MDWFGRWWLPEVLSFGILGRAPIGLMGLQSSSACACLTQYRLKGDWGSTIHEPGRFDKYWSANPCHDGQRATGVQLSMSSVPTSIPVDDRLGVICRLCLQYLPDDGTELSRRSTGRQWLLSAPGSGHGHRALKIFKDLLRNM